MKYNEEQVFEFFVFVLILFFFSISKELDFILFKRFFKQRFPTCIIALIIFNSTLNYEQQYLQNTKRKSVLVNVLYIS